MLRICAIIITREEAAFKLLAGPKSRIMENVALAAKEAEQMKKLAILLADGFEEIEGLTVVDLTRRVGLEITMVSIMGRKEVVSSHNITVVADALFEEMDFDAVDMLVLPGGGPGTKNLKAHAGVSALVDRFYDEKKDLAAICAAPSILGAKGFLKGLPACVFPGFESEMIGAKLNELPANVTEHIITGRGMGCSTDFALAIVAHCMGQEVAKDLAGKILFER